MTVAVVPAVQSHEVKNMIETSTQEGQKDIVPFLQCYDELCTAKSLAPNDETNRVFTELVMNVVEAEGKNIDEV